VLGGGKEESITVSFDPSTLLCICCKTEHLLFRPNTSAIICFSDQNFVPTLPADNNNCISVVRVENASLKDLVDMSFEIFEYLPEKTIVCYGSASHLYRVGASLYAQEWVECNSRISGKWRSISAVPLIPIIREDCPGSLMRDLEQLATWIGRVYSADVRGLLDAWRGVLQATKDFCRGTTVTENTEMFKNPMPSSFDSSKLEPHCYISNTTCPAVLSGLDRKATNNLVRALTRNLHKNFSVPHDPENFLARTNNTTGERAQRTILSVTTAIAEPISLLVAA
jgi:hypothetical protein